MTARWPWYALALTAIVLWGAPQEPWPPGWDHRLPVPRTLVVHADGRACRYLPQRAAGLGHGPRAYRHCTWPSGDVTAEWLVNGRRVER